MIKKFLSQEECELLKADYWVQSHCYQEKNNYNLVASNRLLESVKEKVNACLADIKETTALDVDTLIGTSNYYHNIISARDYYHQDHESFYFWQQNKNFLNFWIPIDKPNPTESGLIVIPMDKLAELIPNDMHRVINNGATAYYPKSDHTVVINNNDGSEYAFDVDISSIEVVPELCAGDLLLMRGDLIHKTQNTSIPRLAISIRCTQGSAPINKSVLLNGCTAKKKLLAGSPGRMKRLLTKFKDLGRDIITSKELL